MLRLVYLSLLAACTPCTELPPPSDCVPQSHRCNGLMPEICSSTKRWHAVGDEACSNGCVISPAGDAVCRTGSGT